MSILHMGGYGAYIWSTYGLTLLVFGFNVFRAWQEKRYVRKIILQQIKQTP